MRYILDFGSTNTGGAPAFSLYKNADTLADVSAPTITEIGSGLYYFEEDWSATSVEAIVYRVALNGVDLADVIRSDTITTGAVTPGAAAGLNTWLWTAGQIVNMAAVEVGLAESSDPYASTDPMFIQLRTLLKSGGFEVSREHDWPVLLREATITGDGTTTSFALPADFLRMAEQSGWQRSSLQPFGGPITPQGWQQLKANGATPNLQPLFRLQQGHMEFYTAPASGETLAYEYVSRYWVASSGASSGDSYFPSVADDVVLLEPHLMARLLVAKFLQAKGFDSRAAFTEYAAALESAKGLDPAPILNAARGSMQSLRLLGEYNAPDTGYGS